MKKILLLLVIPFLTDAQSLVCNFKILKNDTLAIDTLTSVTLHNMTRNSMYSTYTYKTTFYLDNTCEYMLTFKRKNCKTRQVYVASMDLVNCRNYEIFLEIPMEDGEDSVQSNYIGTIWYDKNLDIVRNKIR